MKTLRYAMRNKAGTIEITINVPDEDYEWVRLLFATNANPFKALRDIGYDVEDKGKNPG